MATNTDFIVKHGLVVTDSATFGNTITVAGSIVATGTISQSGVPAIDSAYVTAQINALIDGAPEALNTLNELASALGNDSASYATLLNLISAKSDLDSAQVSSIITADVDQSFVNGLNVDADNLDGQSGSFYLDYTNFVNTPNVLDSAEVTSIVDSTYVQARQDYAYASLTGAPNVLDSALVTSFIDSAYIELRRPAETIFSLSGDGSNYVFTGDGFPSSATDPKIYLTRGKTYKFTNVPGSHPLEIRVSNGGSAYSDGVTNNGGSGTVEFTVPMDAPTSLVYQCTIHSGMIGDIVILDETDLSVDSAFVTGIVDAAYIQANQITYNTSNFTDSAYVTAQIDALIDGAPGTLNTLNEIAAALNDDDSAYATLVTLIGAKTDYDSADTLSLIDSAYVQARQSGGEITIQEEGTPLSTAATTLNFVGSAVTASGSGTTKTITISQAAGGTDSATVVGIIGETVDSAYVQSRQTSGGGGGNAFGTIYVSGQDLIVADSGSSYLSLEAGPGITLATDPNTDTVTITNSLNAEVAGGVIRSIVDSAYVRERSYLNPSAGISVSTYQYIATSGQSVFTGADDNNATLSINTDFDNTLVFLNGTLLIDSDDYTRTNETTITLLQAADSQDRITIQEYAPPLLDSAAIKVIIDSDYILERQSVNARGELDINKFYYTATAAQTVFTGADIFGNTLSVLPSNSIVYLNGIVLVDSADYSLSSNTLTLTSGADSGYSVSVIETIGRVATQNSIVETKYYYTTATPTTVLSGADDNNRTLDISLGVTNLFLNGILLKDSDDYSTTSSTVTLTSATDSGDLVTILNTRGQILTPTLTNYHYTADSGQSSITGADDGGATLTYVNGQVQVFLNGILLRGDIDFTATNGSSIVFTNLLDSADDVVINTFAAPGTYLNQFRYTADSGQLSFSGVDLNNNYLAYEITNSLVFLNGILLTDSDYTATNGNTITLATAANLNDDIIINSFDLGTSTRRVNTWSAPSTTPYPAVAGDKLFINTSSAKTITLPSIAILGDEIRIIDATGNASANNITVARNGHNILGNASDLTINIDRSGIGLVYYNTTQGWILIEN
jgi:hypothetical protein